MIASLILEIFSLYFVKKRQKKFLVRKQEPNEISMALAHLASSTAAVMTNDLTRSFLWRFVIQKTNNSLQTNCRSLNARRISMNRFEISIPNEKTFTAGANHCSLVHFLLAHQSLALGQCGNVTAGPAGISFCLCCPENGLFVRVQWEREANSATLTPPRHSCARRLVTTATSGPFPTVYKKLKLLSYCRLENGWAERRVIYSSVV